MKGALAGGASLEAADWPYEKVVALALALLAAALPKRLGAGLEEDTAPVAAGVLAPKEKAGLGAAGASMERRGHKVVKVVLRTIHFTVVGFCILFYLVLVLCKMSFVRQVRHKYSLISFHLKVLHQQLKNCSVFKSDCDNRLFVLSPPEFRWRQNSHLFA